MGTKHRKNRNILGFVYRQLFKGPNHKLSEVFWMDFSVGKSDGAG